MTAKELRASILDLAIRGKLVPQDPNDEPAEKLLARIAAEKAKLVKSGKLKKGKPLPPITDDDKPFDLPRGWVWCRLGEVLAMINVGIVIRPARYYTQSKEGILAFRNTNVGEGFVEETDWVRVTKQGLEENQRCVLHGNDVAIARSGRPGIACLISSKYEGCAAIDILIATPNQEIVDPKYLMHCINTQFSQHQLTGMNRGIAQSHVGARSVVNMIMTLPPLAEQKRIVEKIEQLMPLVERYGHAEEKRRQLIATLPEALKKSILKSAVEGKLVPQDPNDEPAEKLLARIAAEKAKLIKSGKLKKEKPLPPIADDEKPFALPRGWVWCRFGDLVQTVTGKTPPRAENEWWRNDVPWVAIADMKDGCILTQTKEGVSRRAVETIFQGRISAAGTLLMSFKLTIGKVAILGLDAVHNEAIISIYPYLDVDHCVRNYLFRILPFVVGWGKSKDAIKGSTLNAASIANLLIPLPPLAEQVRIVTRVEECFRIVEGMRG